MSGRVEREDVARKSDKEVHEVSLRDCGCLLWTGNRRTTTGVGSGLNEYRDKPSFTR